MYYALFLLSSATTSDVRTMKVNGKEDASSVILGVDVLVEICK